jgi:predicted transcriptional regulator
MAKAMTLTVRISPEVSEKLESLAHETKHSKARLAGEAIAEFVGRNAWQVARINAALKDARSGRPGIPHERVEEWMDSWDTEHELARPEAKQ